MLAISPRLVAFAFLLSGCATTVEVPATLYTPAAPSAALYDGPGDVSAGGRFGADGWTGQFRASPLPHVGVAVSATDRRPRAATLGAGPQRLAGGAVTLYGPTAGRLRAEVELGAGGGSVSGYSGRFVYPGGCLFGCSPPDESLDASPTTATLRRRYGQVAVATRGSLTAGVLLRVTRASITSVMLADGTPGRDARETFVEPGAFVRFGIGPVDLDLSVGTSHAQTAEAPEEGPPRALGGAYRASPVSGGVALCVGLDDVWRAARR